MGLAVVLIPYLSINGVLSGGTVVPTTAWLNAVISQALFVSVSHSARIVLRTAVRALKIPRNERRGVLKGDPVLDFFKRLGNGSAILCTGIQLLLIIGGTLPKTRGYATPPWWVVVGAVGMPLFGGIASSVTAFTLTRITAKLLKQIRDVNRTLTSAGVASSPGRSPGTAEDTKSRRDFERAISRIRTFHFGMKYGLAPGSVLMLVAAVYPFLWWMVVAIFYTSLVPALAVLKMFWAQRSADGSQNGGSLTQGSSKRSTTATAPTTRAGVVSGRFAETTVASAAGDGHDLDEDHDAMPSSKIVPHTAG